MKDEPELLPCPFCGGMASLVEDSLLGIWTSYQVQCDRCEANPGRWVDDEETAVLLWQMRTKEQP